MTTHELAEAIRTYFDTMSKTDQANILAAVMRAQRKALSVQMKGLTQPRA